HHAPRPRAPHQRRVGHLLVTMLRPALLTIAAAAALAPTTARADREPVLKQIDLPHPYYFREMYLPQLTSGPGSVAFGADSDSVVYSMQGCLWRQRLGSSEAAQLTFGKGYDYQPDVSKDGRYIAFATYLAGAVELQLLDAETGQVTPITQNGAVNVEPRW